MSEQEKVVEAVKEEIQMMAKLNHPNVVRILGATQQGCHFFMFVEWMPGEARFELYAFVKIAHIAISLSKVVYILYTVKPLHAVTPWIRPPL